MRSRGAGRPRSTEDLQYLRHIGDNIRRLRGERRLSQEEFAHIAGFSRSYFTEIETGKRNISVLNLIKIARALDVEPGEVIRSLKLW